MQCASDTRARLLLRPTDGYQGLNLRLHGRTPPWDSDVAIDLPRLSMVALSRLLKSPAAKGCGGSGPPLASRALVAFLPNTLPELAMGN